MRIIEFKVAKKYIMFTSFFLSVVCQKFSFFRFKNASNLTHIAFSNFNNNMPSIFIIINMQTYTRKLYLKI